VVASAGDGLTAGIFQLDLARVRRPFGFRATSRAARSNSWKLSRMHSAKNSGPGINGPNAHAMQPRAKKMRQHEPLPLPMSCLYSETDGVVPPQEATIDGDPACHENIRVPGSHTGLGFNPLVLYIVADRLAQPEGQWQPFKPDGLPGSLLRMATAW
jgi:hypothetical protein